MRDRSEASYALWVELGQKVNDMDMAVVNDLLNEIADGNTLLADPVDGKFNVWVEYPEGRTSMAAFEGVTLATIAEVRARCPSSVYFRG